MLVSKPSALLCYVRLQVGNTLRPETNPEIVVDPGSGRHPVEPVGSSGKPPVWCLQSLRASVYFVRVTPREVLPGNGMGRLGP